MKKDFFDIIDQKLENPDIYLLLGDLGYPRYDGLKLKYPNQVYNCGASEQTMLDFAVGLSYSGKIPVTYTITPFYWRAAETIRTYFDHENLSCILIGAGVKEEYGEHDGFSHSGSDISQLFDIFKNFEQRYPRNREELQLNINAAIKNKRPHFINIHR